MSDNEKIVSLTGQPVGQPGAVNDSCVKALEEALERARAGQIAGVGIVLLWPDNPSAYSLGGRIGGYTMLGAAQQLVHRISVQNSDPS